VHALLAGGRTPLPLALALAWTAGEWVRGSALGPLDFPWMGVVVPLAALPELVQGAAWVGERGLVLGVAAVNGALALGLAAGPQRASAPRCGDGPGGGPAGGPGSGRRVWRPGHPWRNWRAAALAVLAVALAWGGGAVRMARLEPLPVLTALAVQPAVPLAMKRSGGPLDVAAHLGAVEALVPDSALAGVDLVVVPETAVPVVLDAPESAGVRRTVAAWAARTEVPVAVGAYGAAERGGRTNALFLADADPDAAWQRANKRRLVPGVEWAPTDEGGLRPGRVPALLDLPGVGLLGVLICIESAGPEPARRLRALGARVLINVTNDAWLGEAPLWTRTAAFHQHPQHLRLRAVETGVGALREGNGGWTSVVGPDGRERRLLDPYVPGAALAEVRSLGTPTPFTRTGDLAGPVAAVLAGILALVGRVGRGPSQP
jgi:apolipoprotein N-acyltransferase